MKKPMNNKGSALVTVIVALAIVGVLAVIALWVSLINYQMKITDQEVKDNFYSAETVLDQICVGLQNDVSVAYDKAYSDVMVNYSDATEEERKVTFKKEYVYYLRQQLKASDSDMKYDLDKLVTYVDARLRDSDYKTKTDCPAYAEIVSTTATNGEKNGRLDIYETGLCITGIKITYRDKKDYCAVISTDIKLNIPEMNFLTSEEMPDTFSYSIIGNEGIKFGQGVTTVKGSVYAGSPYVVDSSSNDEKSMDFEIGTNVDFTSNKYIIAEGTMEIKSGATVSISSEDQLWTNNILVKGSKLYLAANAYVSDDLTLKGDKPYVSLGQDSKGRYVGFGDDDSVAGDSSAIILNGKDSTLDMSNLDELIVAGYSFIQTSAINLANGENKDVLMGESIALKGNQIAYMVPGECIGVDSYGESVYNRNPLTYTEYLRIKESQMYKLYDDSIVPSVIGHPLSYYISEGEKLEDRITTVFVPGSSGTQDDMLVYFYLSLSKENAENYYKDFYSTNETKLSTYAKYFSEAITSKDSASRVYTAGTYSLYKDEKLSVNSGSRDDISSELTQVMHTYRALSSTLTTNYDKYVGGELDRTVFDNLIDTDKLTSITGLSGAGKKVVKYTDADGQVYDAVLYDNRLSGRPYEVTTQNQEGGKLRLIIATGDVEVSCDFVGTIIAQGKITVNGSVSISSEDEEAMKKLLSASVDTNTYLYDLFENGSSYLVSSIMGGGGSVAEEISYSDIIQYENWTKE